MLAVFEKSIAKPPEELSLPSSKGLRKSMTREQILDNFRSSWTETTVFNLANWNFIALSYDDDTTEHLRSIVVIDDVFCIFVGSLDNTSDLRRHYGLQRQATEALVVVEAYKVLRDRAPYPTDQVIKDLQGNFAFVLFDAAYGTLFAARQLYMCDYYVLNFTGEWLVMDLWSFPTIPASSNKLVDNLTHIFLLVNSELTSCIFKNGSELISFDHPLHKVRAIAREDDNGNICGVIFQVDLYTRIRSIPRTGSAANWRDETAIFYEGDSWPDRKVQNPCCTEK